MLVGEFKSLRHQTIYNTLIQEENHILVIDIICWK